MGFNEQAFAVLRNFTVPMDGSLTSADPVARDTGVLSDALGFFRT
jgi:hypothetical protein